MNDLRTAAQQALEALEAFLSDELRPYEAAKTAAALRAALAQEPAESAQEPCEPLEVLKRALEIIAVGDSKNPQQDAADALVDIGFWSGEAPQPQPKAEPVQEPVAWYQKRGQEVLTSHPACWGREDEPWTPLYTTPPQRKPLTDEEILKATGHCGVSRYTAINIARAIEQAHGIGEQP